jgi:hypothetical protein
MIEMKRHFNGLIVTALLVAASALPGRAQEAGTPALGASPTSPEATPPASVPRPAIVPRTAEPTPASPQATTEPAPRHRRHYAHYRYRRYAYWEPFPVYLPHLYHSRIYWNRIPWFSF